MRGKMLPSQTLPDFQQYLLSQKRIMSKLKETLKEKENAPISP